MVQAVNCHPVTTNAWVQSQNHQSHVCGGHRGSGTSFYHSSVVFPCHCYFASAPYSFAHSLQVTLYDLSKAQLC